MARTTHIERIRNGVDTDELYATIDALRTDPSLARFRFCARNHWIHGAHSRSTIREFHAGGHADRTREEEFVLEAGEPELRLGKNTGPSPAEHLLHALAACLTTSLVYVAAARGVHLTAVESTVEGDIDLLPAFGLEDERRSGFELIRASFRIEGEAPEDTLREIADRAWGCSGVLDVVTNGVPVAIDLTIA
jgi:uncharacterized OsmC-like protein